MIIYIYGSDDFKKDIHELLEHSNIKFRLGENGDVIDLITLEDLKSAIQDNPDNIYLIDDSKIIKKNSLNNKFKFLQPKDGIEQEYLLDNGIGDISVDSIEELSKHIKNKLDTMIDDDDSHQIQESIVEIVEDAYGNDENDEDKNEYIQLDDELQELLSHKDGSIEPEPQIEQIDDISTMLEDLETLSDKKENPLKNETVLDESDNIEEEKDESEDENKYDDLFAQFSSEDDLDKIISTPEEPFASSDEEDYEDIFNRLSFEEDFGNIGIEEKEDNNLESKSNEKEDLEKEEDYLGQEGTNQGEKMSDEFSEFDSLNEADLLAALDGVDTQVTPIQASKQTSVKEKKEETNSCGVNLGSSNANDIAKLISELLNNKTLEITIKVKD